VSPGQIASVSITAYLAIGLVSLWWRARDLGGVRKLWQWIVIKGKREYGDESDFLILFAATMAALLIAALWPFPNKFQVGLISRPEGREERQEQYSKEYSTWLNNQDDNK
jgi:hypothetical protein